MCRAYVLTVDVFRSELVFILLLTMQDVCSHENGLKKKVSRVCIAYYLDKTTLLSLLYWVSNCQGNMPKYYSGNMPKYYSTQSIIIYFSFLCSMLSSIVCLFFFVLFFAIVLYHFRLVSSSFSCDSLSILVRFVD